MSRFDSEVLMHKISFLKSNNEIILLININQKPPNTTSMTKKYYLSILLISLSSMAIAQQDYLEIIADKSCECLAGKRAAKTNLTSEEIGTCLLLATKDYKNQIAEDYNLDLNNLAQENGERLGELIGSKMAFTCPDLLIGAGDTEEEEEYETFATTGKVLNVSKETFVVFELKSDNGRIEKFYWMTYVDSDLNLQNMYDELKDKQVQLEYLEQELFDSRINEYRKFNLITSLTADNP